jgi:hypothetical protein
MSEIKFGENLTWFLQDVSLSEDGLEEWDIDICGETEDGRDTSCSVDIRELCGAAQTKIDHLEAQLKRSAGVIAEMRAMLINIGDKRNTRWAMSEVSELLRRVDTQAKALAGSGSDTT